MSNGKAPVCPVSRNQAVSGMPPNKMPPIPRAQDLPSVIALLNQLALLLNPGVNSGQSTGFSQGESVSGPGDNNTPEQDGGSGGGKRRKGWEEIHRGTEQVEVRNPDDANIAVVFPRVFQLKYEEHQTLVELRWHGNFPGQG
jgi:hypothetical protein